MILACVLECSSIAAMVYLTVLVVSTRIGVNKDLPDQDKAAPSRPATIPRPVDPTPDRRPTPAVRRPATSGEVALMVGVLIVLVAGTLTIAVMLTQWM
jgi:hypothetical protein